MKRSNGKRSGLKLECFVGYAFGVMPCQAGAFTRKRTLKRRCLQRTHLALCHTLLFGDLYDDRKRPEAAAPRSCQR